MRARSVEELQVYQKALIAADEISAILKRESFRSDWRLRAQLGGSSESVPALIAEGFSQKTDRHFAELLYRSRGEGSETRTHLRAARTRDHISSRPGTANVDLQRDRKNADWPDQTLASGRSPSSWLIGDPRDQRLATND